MFKVEWTETTVTRYEALVEADSDSAARQAWIDGDYVMGPDEIPVDYDDDVEHCAHLEVCAVHRPLWRQEWARIAFEKHGVTENDAGQGTDQIDLAAGLFGADPLPRYLLIQRNDCHGGRYVTPVDSPEDAAHAIAYDEYAEEWETLALVDLDTGNELSATTTTTFS